MNRNVFEKCEIDIAETGCAERIAAHRSKAALRRINKGIWVDPLDGLALLKRMIHACVRIAYLNGARVFSPVPLVS